MSADVQLNLGCAMKNLKEPFFEAGTRALDVGDVTIASILASTMMPLRPQVGYRKSPV